MFHHFTVEEETYGTLQKIFLIPEIKKNFALAGTAESSILIKNKNNGKKLY